MDDYESLVASAFFRKSRLPFSNKNALHARVVMKYIFINAKEKVVLCSNELIASVQVGENSDDSVVEVYDWQDLLDVAKKYLENKKAQLMIKVKKERSSSNPNVKTSNKFVSLSNEFPNQVKLEWGAGQNLPDFMANDTGAFRIELEGEYKAIACAYDEKTANKLLDLYECP